MTMEVILSTAFGRAVDVQGGNGGKLYQTAIDVFASFVPGQDRQITTTRILQFLSCEHTYLCTYARSATFVTKLIHTTFGCM